MNTTLSVASTANKSLINTLLTRGLQAFLLLTLICIFVPFFPHMPAEGLDESWVFGINQAFAQGLSFGHEMIFTYGPYLSIYTKQYHPASDHLMLVGAAYLAVSYWIVLLFLTKGQWRQMLPVFFMLFSCIYYFDVIFYIYPLLTGLTCFNLLYAQPKTQSNERLSFALMIIFFAPFGLLPLIKGTIFILCATMMACLCVLFLSKKRWALAAAVVGVPLVASVFFWFMSGQAIINLPGFFISLMDIIAGYSEAMAIDNRTTEVLACFLLSCLLLIVLACEQNTPLKARLIRAAMFALFLFVAFKGGFVRHDAHAILAAVALLCAALLAFLILNSGQSFLLILGSACLFVYIDGHYTKFSTATMVNKVASIYLVAWDGLKQRLTNKNWPETVFANSLQSLKDKAKFPILKGTSDIYSYNQSYLIASGNHWKPRPILQSYSAYTPTLVEKNRQHLLGTVAPDNVIFSVEAIDNRLPSLEDGASWPVLLTRYEPVMLEKQFLFLRQHKPEIRAPELLLISKGSYKLGEEVVVPKTSTPVFAEITLTPSFLGRLANILYKSSELQITLQLANGSSKSFRFIAKMAKSGLIISPLIETTDEFQLLYERPGLLLSKQVKSFSIKPAYGARLWKDAYQVVFKKLENVFLSESFKFAPLLHPSPSTSISLAKKCEGAIDSLNGFAPHSASLVINDVMAVHGWLAKSVEPVAKLPESVLLVLNDEKTGKSLFITTKKMSRTDVGVYFKQPALDLAGYTATVDMSAMRGNYRLGLAYTEGNSIKICPQFKVMATINEGIIS